MHAASRLWTIVHHSPVAPTGTRTCTCTCTCHVCTWCSARSIITKHIERYLALHEIIRQPGMHCSRPFRIKCSTSCFTRSDALPDAKHNDYCARTSSGRIADEWCSVQTLHSEAQCCGLGRNTSCTNTIGSNKWPQPFRQAAIDLKRNRFVRVPPGGDSR